LVLLPNSYKYSILGLVFQLDLFLELFPLYTLTKVGAATMY